MFPAVEIGGGDENLERRVACAGPHARQRRVDASRAVLHGNDRIRDAQRQVVMGMNAAFGFRLQDAIIGLKARGYVLHGEPSTAIGHVYAVRTVAFHQLGLFGQSLRRAHMTHHQEARDIHAEAARVFDVLLGNVGFGAMRGDPHRSHTDLVRMA